MGTTLKKQGSATRTRDAPPCAATHLRRLENVQVGKGTLACCEEIRDVCDIERVGIVEVTANAVEENLGGGEGEWDVRRPKTKNFPQQLRC